MKKEIRHQNICDIKTILFNQKQYYSLIEKRYSDSLTGFQDLLSSDQEKPSLLYWLINRNLLHWMSNNPEIAIDKNEIAFRKKLYPLIKKLGAGMMLVTQVVENPEDFGEQQCVLPNKPVIFAANHGFRDDVLATVIAAGRHAYLFCGSVPMFYNSFNGFACSLIGDIIVNRKSNQSRKASLDKGKRVLELGTDLIIFPEGGWNKSAEKMTLELWSGVWEISKLTGCDVVPIAHYNRDPEVLDKKNTIHTMVGAPIPLYNMEKIEALNYLRDVLSTYQWKMMERYGKSTRAEEMNGFETSLEKWIAHLTERMKAVEYYDTVIERKSEYRPKEVIRAEDVFRQISLIKNITPKNVKHILYARDLVENITESDYSKLF